MVKPRAADDFATIRHRVEELRRERLATRRDSGSGIAMPGHRGPCACGLALFPDECDGSCKAL